MRGKSARIAAPLILLVAALFAPAPSAAQTPGIGDILSAPAAEEGTLRERQRELFEQLIVEPDNLDVMFEYAQVSVRVEDYEAAISTLERMLIYRQDLPRVRLELAVAYFNLGSYALAQLYFDQVLDSPETPDAVRERIARYTEAIELRSRRHTYRVIATAGITHATNATLGPDSNQILFAGNNATLIAGQSQSDTGLRVTLDLNHAYDLGQEDDDTWRTEFGFYGVNYFDTEEGNLLFARVRTGPRLSLDAQQFGPKMRPYGEVQYLASAGRELYAAYTVGTEYLDTLSPVLSVYGDLGAGYRNYFRARFSDEDQYFFYGAAGLAYIPIRNLILRSTFLFNIESAEGEQNSNQEIGLRLSGEYGYDPQIDWVQGRWVASAFIEGRVRFFEQPDPIVDPTTIRKDFDIRGGVRHVFALREGFGIQVDVDGLLRESNVVNFDLNNLSATISLRYQL